MYQRQVTKQGLSGIVLENNKGSKKAKFSLEDLKVLNIHILCRKVSFFSNP